MRGDRATDAIDLMMTDLKEPTLTDRVVAAMMNILCESATITRELAEAADLPAADREALLSATTKINAQADWVLSWLDKVPLETQRQ